VVTFLIGAAVVRIEELTLVVNHVLAPLRKRLRRASA
jgi:hypothetical protein